MEVSTYQPTAYRKILESQRTGPFLTSASGGAYQDGEWMPQWHPTGRLDNGVLLGSSSQTGRFSSREVNGRFFLVDEVSATDASSPVVRITCVEQLDEVMTVFSLNVSDASRVLGVSRESIYKWRRGGAIRRKPLIERLNSLTKLAHHWRGLSSLPLGEALHQQIPESDQSFFEFLQSDFISEGEAETFLRRLAALNNDHWAGADALIQRNAADGWEGPPPGLHPDANRPRFRFSPHS